MNTQFRIIFLLFISMGFFIGAQDATGQEELIHYISAVRSSIPNIECEYEGHVTQLIDYRKNQPSSDIKDNFTGKYVRRNDGSQMMEIYHRYAPKFSLTKESLLYFDGKVESFLRDGDRPAKGNGEIRRASIADNIRGATPYRVLLIDLLYKMLHYDKASVELKGEEMFNEKNCKIIDLVTGVSGGLPAKNKRTTRFWVDFNDTGHPLKVEDIDWMNQTCNRIVVESFNTFQSNGKSYKLPTKSKYENFTMYKRDMSYSISRTPVDEEVVILLPSTFLFPDVIRDSQFTLNYLEGVHITDKTKNLEFEFSKNRVSLPRSKLTSRAESEKMLERQLKIAEDQKDELVAASWRRSGSETFQSIFYGILLVLFLSLLAGCFVYMIKNRRKI